MLSHKINSLTESLTIAITTKAKKMISDGFNVISLSAGEPDFDTPRKIKEATIAAIEGNKGGKYTPVPGSFELLEAICEKLKRDNNLTYTPNQVMSNVGAKHSLFNVFQCILNEGDEVIIGAPFWVTYPEIVKFSGGKPVIIYTKAADKFKLTAEQIKAAITPRTRAIVLNSPSNPCGGVYSRSELEEIDKVLHGTQILVVSDEIYEKLDFSGEFVATAAVSEEMFHRTITINGLSKCGAMPGWRFGYTACANGELNAAMRKLQSQSTSNIASIVQAGAIVALKGEIEDDIAAMKEEFKKRRDFAVEAINAIDGLSVVKPDGAFYLFVDCHKIETDSIAFCSALLERALVACVPGVGFGMDGFFRLSYACDMDSLRRGIERIADFVKSYKK